MLLGLLAFISLALTYTMFSTRQMMLGFTAVMFWAITGAQAYTLSTVPWGDIYFYIFFASAFGMTIFCSMAMYGLRERKDTEAEGEAEEKGTDWDKDFYGEKGEKDESGSSEDKISDRVSSKPSERTRRLRARADKRKTNWGEFK